MLSLMLGLFVSAGEPDAQLLSKLTAHSERLAVLEKADGTLQLSSKSNELDASGKATHTKEIDLVIVQTAGIAKTQLKRFIEDGTDATEAMRADIESGAKKASRSQEMGISSMSPFTNEARGKYSFSVETRPQEDAGLVRLSFWPKGEKSPELMLGEALIDAASGELVKLSMQPSKNPPFVEKLSFEVDFDDRTSAGRAVSRMRVHRESGMSVIKKRFDSVTTFQRAPGG